MSYGKSDHNPWRLSETQEKSLTITEANLPTLTTFFMKAITGRAEASAVVAVSGVAEEQRDEPPQIESSFRHPHVR